MRAAKVLSIAAIAIVLAGGAIISGWAVFGQETVPQQALTDSQAGGAVLDAATLQSAKTMPPQQAADLLQPILDQAKQAMVAGQYELAATRYLQLAVNSPRSPRTANAILGAADAYSKAGKTAEAKGLYDRAAATARELLVVDYSDPSERKKLAQTFKPDSAKKTLRRALAGKAKLCRASGDIPGAWNAIQEFRAEEPEFHNLRDVLPLQAELQGVDPAVLQTQEAEAAKLSDRAKWAWKAGDSDLAYQLADSAITQYPESSGAILCKSLKVKMLWRHKRYPEAKALCQEIVAQLQIAPTCDLVREASVNIAWLESTRLHKDLQARKRRNQPITAQEWEQVRDHCRTVMRWDRDANRRATMHIQMVESLAWEGKESEVLDEVAKLLHCFDRPSKVQNPDLKRIVMWARLFKGRALTKLGRNDEAQIPIRETIAAYENDPKGWELGGPLPSAYYSLWRTLRAAGSSPDECKAAAAPLFEHMPGSVYVMSILNPKD